eukprot:TRINITY_DN721_c0_g5_i1.p1 TRINITY_DN721_c0_g5~~TRINITY_DN721_c0_g5_i1.p1  ORF type:complete len:158 (+),score=20.88 TRINITY_DN721_c0_g5_i1:64-537(+)
MSGCTDMTLWGATRNKKRMMRFWWAAKMKKDLVFGDHLCIVAGFLGEYDEEESRPLTEEALRVLASLNGKESSWIAGQVLQTTVGAVTERSAWRRDSFTSPSNKSTEGLSEVTDSPKSSPASTPPPTVVFQLQPRMPLSSLDRAPSSRKPEARFAIR